MSETIKYQIISVVFLQIIVCLTFIRSFYHYFGRGKLSGETLRKVYGSRMRAIIRTAYFLVFVVVCGSCIWKMFQEGMETIYTDYLYLAVLIIEAVVALGLDMFPQKFCENGIIGYRDFIPWSAMRGILDSKRKSVIIIKVHERVNYREQISCRPEEKEELERYILEKIEEHKKPESLAPEAVNS